jgi:hypothetical protein
MVIKVRPVSTIITGQLTMKNFDPVFGHGQAFYQLLQQLFRKYFRGKRATAPPERFYSNDTLSPAAFCGD